MQPTKRMTFVIASALLMLGAVAGCDQSKAELDSTKQQLTAITAEGVQQNWPRPPRRSIR